MSQGICGRLSDETQDEILVHGHPACYSVYFTGLGYKADLFLFLPDRFF